MCGIAGIFDIKGGLNPELMSKMLDFIRHRGPDDSGIACFNTKNKKTSSNSTNSDFILGHVRLSIIDLSCAGHQPMANHNGSIWIVYNGEIFNYLEIRNELEAKGYAFKSNTDTEVLLYLYQEFGESCLERLRGFFAFCIYDAEKKKLFMARDRFGLKPFKYYWDGKTFAFASELKAILQIPWISKEADPTAIDQYLGLRYVLPPLTGVKNIKKLPAGCSLILNLGNLDKGLIINQYWLPRFEPKTTLSFADASTKTEELLEEAIRIRMMSDVPLGIFLSGGIDSSAIVALLRKQYNGPIHTFSVGFTNSKYDEREYAKMVADLYGTTHTELLVETNLKKNLQKIIWHFDEPFSDPSAIPSFYLAKAASQYVKVILSGEGGDELFAGYKRYAIHNRNRYLDYLPEFLFKLSENILNKIPFSADKKRGWGKLGRILESVSGNTLKTYPLRFSALSRRTRENLYDNSAGYTASENVWTDDILKLLYQAHTTHPMEKLMALDQLTSLPEDILMKADITGMSHSIETRAPFLDHIFAEWVNCLPLSYKYKTVSKHILRHLLKDKLPHEILKRKKAGFNPPMEEWMRNELNDSLKHYLFSNDSPLKIFKTKTFKAIYDIHMSGRSNFGEQLWLLLALGVWCEQNKIKINC